MSENIEKLKLDMSVLNKTENCDVHGEYQSKGVMGGKFWLGCPVCSDVRSAEVKAHEAEREARERKEQWERKLGHACIPERYHDRRLDNFITKNDGQQNALNVSRIFADEFKQNKGRSLIFCGLPGTGKTHLANAICLHIMENHKASAMFTTVMKAIRRIKETWNKNNEESETQAIDAFVWPDLLVLDEIGVQFGSDTEKQLLFDILNERYEQRKPTILISNLPVKEVIAFIGERVYDRLKEDGGQSLVFNWKSHRGVI